MVEGSILGGQAGRLAGCNDYRRNATIQTWEWLVDRVDNLK